MNKGWTINLKDINITEVELSEEDKTKPIAEITIPTIINTIVGFANQQRGLLKPDRIVFYDLLPKLEETLKSKVEILEITDEECGFIRKCFRETRLPPTSMLEAVEKHFDNLKK